MTKSHSTNLDGSSLRKISPCRILEFRFYIPFFFAAFPVIYKPIRRSLLHKYYHHFNTNHVLFQEEIETRRQGF